MSPGSNGSSTNNNNVGSPSPITSDLMGPIPPNSSTPSDLENQGSINGDQIMGGGTISGSVVGSQSAWTPPSVNEEDSSSPTSGLSPTRGISSPGNTTLSSTSMYSMIPNHPNLALKSELSSPGGNSPNMLPSYPISNGGVMSSLGAGESNSHLGGYINDASATQQPFPPSSMMTASLWYSGSESTPQAVHPMSHMNHRGMNENYLK